MVSPISHFEILMISTAVTVYDVCIFSFGVTVSTVTIKTIAGTLWRPVYLSSLFYILIPSIPRIIIFPGYFLLFQITVIEKMETGGNGIIWQRTIAIINTQKENGRPGFRTSKLLVSKIIAESHSSVGRVQDLETGGRLFDPRLGQYSF